LFGGQDTPTHLLQDLWEWDGGAWAARTIAGPGPAYRNDLIFDTNRARIVLHQVGGATYTRETWEYDGQTWLFRTGSAPDLSGLGARSFVYDAAASLGRWIEPASPMWEYRGAAPAEPVWFRAAVPARFVPAGTNIVFAADVGGSDPRTYQWLHNGVPLAD